MPGLETAPPEGGFKPDSSGAAPSPGIYARAGPAVATEFSKYAVRYFPMRRLSLCLAVLLLAAGCDRRAAPTAAVDAPAPKIAKKPAPVAPVEPERKGWLGVVVARESVDVTADSPGRLQAVYVSIGDRVKRGDRIASLDTRIATQDLEMARSSLQGDEADERRATDELAEAQARNDRRRKNPH